MEAGKTGLGSLLALMQVAAIPAAPDNGFSLFEHRTSLYVAQESEIPLLVLFLSD